MVRVLSAALAGGREMARNNGEPLVLFNPPRIRIERTPEGASEAGLLLWSAEPLGDHPTTVVALLYADPVPDGVIVAEKS